MFVYFVILSLVWCLVPSSAVEATPSAIKDLPTENKNRIKSKHLEMWDIILSILERKEALENILKIHYSLSDRLGKTDLNIRATPKCKQNCNGGDSLDKLDKKKLNYLEQYYNFNVDMSTLIIKELSRLSELEKECQALI